MRAAAASVPAPVPGSARYFTLLYTARERRIALATLLAIGDELASGRARELDHAVAHVRLEWWQLEAQRFASAAPTHPWLIDWQKRAQAPLIDLAPLVHTAALDLAGQQVGRLEWLLAGERFVIAASVLGASLNSMQQQQLRALGQWVESLEARRAPQAAASERPTLDAFDARLLALLAPLSVWAALALHQAQRRWRRMPGKSGKMIDYGWDAFTDNFVAWRAARRAAAGRLEEHAMTVSADAAVDTTLAAHLRFYPSPEELAGRVVAITGAGDGIGRAVALAAAAHGAEVVLIGRTVRKLEQVHDQITALKRAEASIAPLDLEKALARDYDQLASALQQRYGKLDGLIHNAAILGALSPIEHYNVPLWCRVLHVNLTAAFALTQVLMPALRASPDASVIFTSSGVARRPKAYWGAYAVSKAGAEALSRVLAEELETNTAVRANVLNPGPVQTRMRLQAYPAEDRTGLAAPEDVVRPYLWLLSGASRGVTGQSLDCQAAR